MRFNNIIKKMPNSLYIFLATCIIFSFLESSFLSLINIGNLLLQSSVLITLSIGTTLIVITGGLDLSVGSILTFSGVVIGLLLSKGYFIYWAILLGLLASSACGFISGILITQLRVPPFISTFAMMGIAQGLANKLSGRGVIHWGECFLIDFIGKNTFLGLSIMFWIAIIIFVVVLFFFEFSPMRPYIFAIGSNEEAARLSKIDIKKLKCGLYMFSGFLAGIGGLMMISRMNTAEPTAGVGLEFDAVVAIVLGGTPLSGGKGNLIGTLFGAITIAMLKNGLSLFGLQTAWQRVVIGIILVLSVLFNQIIMKKQLKA